MTQNFEVILDEAHAAASKAIADKYAAGDREQPFNCGFAWVTIDGREELAGHCRSRVKLATSPGSGQVDREDRIRYGDKGEPGWRWWKPGTWPRIEGVPSYQQDMGFHAAAASAFQQVLASHGIRATVGTRLD